MQNKAFIEQTEIDLDISAQLADGWNSLDRTKQIIPGDVQAAMPQIKNFLHDYQL